jgi:ParB family chromosome partitioning protein
MTDTDTTISDVPLRAIHANPQDRTVWQTNRAREQMDELVSSIRQHGLVQPITVRPCDCDRISGDHNVIGAGERRYRAHRALELPSIRAIIRNDMDAAGHLDTQLIENLNRTDLDPIEEAQAYRRRMQELDLDVEAVAARYGKAAAFVQKRLDLLTLDDEFIPFIRRGELTVQYAACMAGLDLNRQRFAFKALRHAKGTLPIWPFQQLCDRLRSEQDQETMFDDDFMTVEEYTTDARNKSKIGGRALVHLAADLGEAVEPFYDVLVEAGADADSLRVLLDKAAQVKATRVDAMDKPSRTGSTRGRRKAAR